MKKLFVVVVLAVVAALIFWRVRDGGGGAEVNYRFVAVTEGDLAAVVAATGTLEPVTTVQVGTQVSGIIDQVDVDFNDRVTAGQVIARIDTTLLASAMASSRSQVDRAQAELRHAQREYTRLSALHEAAMISDSDFNTAQYNLDIAGASLRSARIDLDRSARNLGYATITAPIDGVVVQRSVDPGQTVQASFSSPELFRIAGDLTDLQILVSVDESDIGQIAEGQSVRFTVQAYPDDTFSGAVRQVRLQSVVEENVVNYIAVVTVANPDGRLLPGMTASVDFIVEQATAVLYVPNAALRYKPDAALMQSVLERKRAERESRRAQSGETAAAGDRPAGAGGAGGVNGGPGAGGGAAAGRDGQMPADRGMLWTIGDNGDLDVILVRTGISDGTSTEVKGRELVAGKQIIAGVTSSAAAASSSPFQQQNQRRSGPPSPGGF